MRLPTLRFDSSVRCFVNTSLQPAIATRESSVESCQGKITDVKGKMEPKLENLRRLVKKTEERVTKMEEVLDSLNHNQKRVINNIRIDIQQQKEDIEVANDKGNALKKVIEVATQLIGAAGLAATGIAQLVNSLQSIGLFR
jgi:chromosome segregation ATPase